MKKRQGFVNFWGVVTMLTGTIIGAGVLAIPYAMMKAGFLTGLLVLVILSIASIFVYLYIGEIVLRTKKKHQLTGYAGKYLGINGKRLMTLSMIFGNYGALVAYLIGIGQSMTSLFGVQNNYLSFFGFSISFNTIFGLLFFFFGSSIIHLGIKKVEESDFLMSFFIIFIILFLSVISFLSFNKTNLLSFDIKKIFLPYGVILFALAGAIAVPEMREEIQDAKNFKKAIIIGVTIPILLYLIFSLAIVGSCGNSTSEIAVNCLADKAGNIVLWLGNIFAILAMATGFFTLGLGLKEMYNYDFRIKERKSWFLACFIPLIIFILTLLFIKHERFYKTIGITGGVAITLEGMLIVMMFQRAKKLGDRKPEYSIKENKFISIILIIIFLLGMIYTILSFFGFI